MKRTNITVNAIENTIAVSKAFYKKASVFGTEEYNMLRNAMIENPQFSVELKTSEKKTYSGLTFKRMEDYIKTQPNSVENLCEFKSVKEIAKLKGSAYPLTKEWFLKKFKDYKGDITVAEITTLKEEIKREEAALKVEAPRAELKIA